MYSQPASHIHRHRHRHEFAFAIHNEGLIVPYTHRSIERYIYHRYLRTARAHRLFLFFYDHTNWFIAKINKSTANASQKCAASEILIIFIFSNSHVAHCWANGKKWSRAVKFGKLTMRLEIGTKGQGCSWCSKNLNVKIWCYRIFDSSILKPCNDIMSKHDQNGEKKNGPIAN